MLSIKSSLGFFDNIPQIIVVTVFKHKYDEYQEVTQVVLYIAANTGKSKSICSYLQLSKSLVVREKLISSSCHET